MVILGEELSRLVKPVESDSLDLDLVDRTAKGNQSCLLDGDGKKGNVEGF